MNSLRVSVLYREPKLLKARSDAATDAQIIVSVLYREPKLLKGSFGAALRESVGGFSALP